MSGIGYCQLPRVANQVLTYRPLASCLGAVTLNAICNLRGAMAELSRRLPSNGVELSSPAAGQWSRLVRQALAMMLGMLLLWQKL